MDAVIKGSFWTDPRVEELTKDERNAALWLFTNPSRDLCGFTSVSNKRFEFETGLTEKDLEGASKGLPSSIKKLPGGVWFVVNFLRHQFGKGGRLKLGNKVIIAAARHAAGLPTEQANAFFEAYPELRELGLKHYLERERSEGASEGDAAKPEGVRVRAGAGERAGERKEGCGENPTEASPAMRAEQLCLAHPMKARTGPALAAAMAALKRHPFEELLAGTVAYAEAVAGWTEAEQIQFVKNPEAFFREDIWRQPAANWRSRTAAKQTNGQHVRPIDIGGRRPASVETAHLH